MKRGSFMIKTLALSSSLGIAIAFTGAAQAAPVSANPMPGIEASKIALQYRRCWYDDGRRVCRFGYGYRDYDWRYRDRDDRWRWWRRDRDRHFRRERD